MRTLKYGTAGLFYDMIEQEYRGQTAIAGSDAKHILAPKTPAHYAAHMAGETKREPSKAMMLGTMAHVAVLEPQKLDAAFVERPEGIDLRTKLGKEWKDSVGSMPVLDQDEARAVRGIRDSIAANKAAKDLLADTRSEVSVFGESHSGLWIKGRIDALKPGTIVDVKTTSAGADANAFARQSFALNYHVSAAWYWYLATLNEMPPKAFYWVAVEVQPPYAVAVYEIHKDALQLGFRMMQDALALIARCEDDGHWPGYGDEVQTLNLPLWAYKQEGAA
jgi:exodeoxyribonuclease VIII